MASFNLNKVILGGRLTADPELQSTPQGTSVCSFKMAVDRPYSKDEQKQADFIPCVAWRQTAEFITKYFSKGSSVCVEGAIQIRSWINNAGVKQYKTEIIVDKAHFVDGKQDSVPKDTREGYETPEGTEGYSAPQYEELNSDEDLPF